MWSVLLFLSTIQLQDLVYQTGAELLLHNGTTILTDQEIQENAFFYFWYEGSEYIRISKDQVEAISYFGYHEPRRLAPPARTHNQQRIDKNGVSYEVDGTVCLRVLHTTEHGKVNEGFLQANKVIRLEVLDSPQEGGLDLLVTWSLFEPQGEFGFRFFDVEGQLVFDQRIDLASVRPSKKDRRAREASHRFRIRGVASLAEIGLVEGFHVKTKP